MPFLNPLGHVDALVPFEKSFFFPNTCTDRRVDREWTWLKNERESKHIQPAVISSMTVFGVRCGVALATACIFLTYETLLFFLHASKLRRVTFSLHLLVTTARVSKAKAFTVTAQRTTDTLTLLHTHAHTHTSLQLTPLERLNFTWSSGF